MPARVDRVSTFWTGVSVTSMAVRVTVRGAEAPRSRMEKVCAVPGADGNSPALRMSTLAWSEALTTSTPSTLSTSAPRARSAPAAVAGEPGCV